MLLGVAEKFFMVKRTTKDKRKSQKGLKLKSIENSRKFSHEASFGRKKGIPSF